MRGVLTPSRVFPPRKEGTLGLHSDDLRREKSTGGHPLARPGGFASAQCCALAAAALAIASFGEKLERGENDEGDRVQAA